MRASVSAFGSVYGDSVSSCCCGEGGGGCVSFSGSALAQPMLQRTFSDIRAAVVDRARTMLRISLRAGRDRHASRGRAIGAEVKDRRAMLPAPSRRPSPIPPIAHGAPSKTAIGMTRL
jgi:hypothetical protein